MAIDLRDKPICITGASSGIGAATAVVCAAAGMPVVLAARREEKLAAVAERIHGSGGRAEICVMNVDDPGGARSMIEHCLESFGSIYAVFANAGYGFEKPMLETSDDELRAIFETNFWGTIHALRAAVPPMLDAGRGHLLICSSCIGKFAVPFYGPYCATKAAQWHIGRAMDHELRDRGIRVSTVHPVGTTTEFFDEAQRRSPPSVILSDKSERFMQPPERVARAVLKSLRRPRTEVWTSLTVRLAAAAFTASPRLADALLRWKVVKPRQRAAAGRDVPGQGTT